MKIYNVYTPVTTRVCDIDIVKLSNSTVKNIVAVDWMLMIFGKRKRVTTNPATRY